MPNPTNIPLLYNPFNSDLLSFIRDAIKNEIYNIQTCIPAIVTKVIRRDKVLVSPAVQPTNSEGELIEWAQIPLRVHTPAGGGAIISFPLKKGDTGWIIAGDLDPSLFLQKPIRPAGQNVFNRHDYQFGFFMPDKLADYQIEGDADALIIQTTDGTRVLIKDGKIDIKSTGTLNINAQNVTINGTDWATHTHQVGTLTVPVTGKEGASSTITGSTGGVNK